MLYRTPCQLVAQSGHLLHSNLLLQPTGTLTRQCAIEKMHSMNDRQPILDFDPGFCRKVAKWGAVICLSWLGIAICILALVHPGSHCPAWTIHDKNGGGTSLWVIVSFFIGFPTIWLWFIVLRWKGFTRMIYDIGVDSYKRFLSSKGWDYQNKPAPYTFPLNQLFVVAVGMWGLFCSMPIWLMILPCL